MKVAYVCGPYRARSDNLVLGNIMQAREIAAWLWQLGFAVVCPHSNSALMGGVAEEGVFLKGYIEILKRCDLLVLVVGWAPSAGAAAEVAAAKEQHIPIFQSWGDGVSELVAFSKEEE